MNRRWTLFATSLLALSAALVTFHHPKPQAPGPAAGLPPLPPAKPERTARTAVAAIRTKTLAASRESRSDAASLLDHGPRRAAREAAQAQAAATRDFPTQAELARRAQLVERDANHELARLVPLLELQPDQQERVFQALARTSPNFVPGMQVDGTPLQPSAAADSQQTLLAELSDTQVAAYLQDSDERSAWWSEYIGSVASQLANGTPAIAASTGSATVADVPVGDTTAPVAAAPATKDAHVISGNE